MKLTLNKNVSGFKVYFRNADIHGINYNSFLKVMLMELF